MSFSIILILLGILFVLIGALIYFKNMCFLAVGSDGSDKTKQYAYRFGKAQFICGIWMTAIGTISLFLKMFFAIVLFIVTIVLVFTILGIVFSKRNKN